MKIIKEVYENGNIKYQGECKDGKYHGEGTQYSLKGIINYEGEWKDGDRHGQGILYDENGDIEYQGEWKYDKILIPKE